MLYEVITAYKKTVDNKANSGIIDKKPLLQFKTSENIKDADAFASDILGIPKVSYRGVDVETANA